MRIESDVDGDLKDAILRVTGGSEERPQSLFGMRSSYYSTRKEVMSLFPQGICIQVLYSARSI